MKISVCYIVKNEAKVLARSLESVKESVDEIVVVDTGSTDGSQKIARQYGARVIQSVWQDDFALARNHAIEHADGDWIVFLDADEYFDMGRNNVRSWLQAHQQDAVDVFLIRMHNIDEENGALLVDFFAPRIFRNRLGLRYYGQIHEQLEDKGRPVSRVAFVPENKLSIIHTGYSAVLSKSKAKRNLDLLQQSIEQGMPPEKFYGYLAESYEGLGDSQQAKQYAYKDIALGRRNITYASCSYRILLRLLANEPENFVERQQTAARAVQDFPELPEFHAEYAESLAYVFEYEAAIQEMQQALQRYAVYKSPEPMMFNEKACQLGKERQVLWENIQQRIPNIRISSCIIVKNEEKNMAAWLEKARVYSDEIILVDTGSTDRTKEIVQQQGVPVRNFVWDENFSHAKNFALEQAQGDWVVFLDADETFKHPERVRPFLAEMDLCRPQQDVVFIKISNVDTECRHRENQHFLNVRIFKNTPELRYEGRIHEGIQRLDGKPLQTFLENDRLEIYHTGYSSGIMRSKLQRNLELLQADIAAQGGENVRHYRYLASSYFSLGEYEKALHYIELHLASPYEILYSESDMYYLAICCLENLPDRQSEITRYIEKGIARFPDLPDFYALRGLRWFRRGAQMAAVPDLKHSLQCIGKSKEASRMENLLPEVYTALAVSARLAKDGASARVYAGKALAMPNSSYADFVRAYDIIAEAVQADVDTLVQFFQQAAAGDSEKMNFYISRLAVMGELELYGRLAVDDGLKTFYQQVKEGQKQTVYESVMKLLPDEIKKIFWAEIFMSQAQWEKEAEVGNEAIDLLPVSMRGCILRYRGKIKKLSEEYLESYQLYLPDLMGMGNRIVLRRYLSIVFDFSWKIVAQTARQLMDKFLLEEAAMLYEKIPEGAVQGAEYSYDLGVFYYLAGDKAQALRYFQQAEAQGFTGEALSSYLQWIGGGKNA